MFKNFTNENVIVLFLGSKGDFQLLQLSLMEDYDGETKGHKLP